MIGLHEHAWTEATCESAKTCETCGEIEGEALGHNWSDATCLKKKDNKKLSIFCLCQNKPVYLHRFVPTGPCGRVG